MLAKILSVTPHGMDIICVSVETYVAERGFPSFDIVGLPSKEITESKHRVLTAMKNSGIAIPAKKIVINLGPADIPKVGSFLDLPIAISLMATLLDLPIDLEALYFGELSLDGTLRYTHGAFLLGLFAQEYRKSKVFLPMPCAKELANFREVSVFPVKSLAQLVEHFSGLITLSASTPETSPIDNSSEDLLIDSVVGQESAKRATLISVSGGHNVFFTGPPGVGKTMLAKSCRALLPELSVAESLEVTKIHSLGRKLEPGHGIVRQPPFRSPHHTISYTGMVGGGSIPVPGEISFAHRGVLFMDEFVEFPRKVLEALRQPLETGRITINRSKGAFTYPCEFILIGACNPCPCGYYNHPRKPCTCSLSQIHSYQQKLSGPLIDRIDLFVSLSPPEHYVLDDLMSKKQSSQQAVDKLKAQIGATRLIQKTRFENSEKLNAHMSNADMQKYCSMTTSAKNLLEDAYKKLDLSVRTYTKVLKVARTIADLADKFLITEEEISEALLYRR